MAVRYKGLTWDHPRGFNALAAAASRLDPAREGISIDWSSHPLEGFESHPIADLAERYDLVVIDHPHLGEALNGDCFLALEEMFSAEEIAAWGAATIGQCLSSYCYAGRHWALPLDAAAQVTAYVPDLLDGPVPADWAAVADLAGRAPVALSLAGPHALLSFMSICVALGEPPASRDPGVLVSSGTGRAALEILSPLAASSPDWTRNLNPKDLLEAMAGGEPLALVPLVFGYVNYTVPSQPGRCALRFADAPTAAGGTAPGSTLGGTGLAVSRRAVVTPGLLDHLRWLMAPQTQRGFIPDHEGQPSSRAAWSDATVNAASGNFYRDTAATLEAAWVRPRHDGYIAFQSEASATLRDAMTNGVPAETILSRLQDRYARSRTGQRAVTAPKEIYRKSAEQVVGG
ncbi:carbohydrate ABC transporter substrate-binding protein [Microbaculum marinum]|uniref:Carbohydrate ABC transporter substrate-binding protein n=1 Tax=Microbaculum marinum TaxID=1764581 RepID=A0AAW9RLJ7_9HYPH